MPSREVCRHPRWRHQTRRRPRRARWPDFPAQCRRFHRFQTRQAPHRRNKRWPEVILPHRPPRILRSIQRSGPLRRRRRLLSLARLRVRMIRAALTRMRSVNRVATAVSLRSLKSIRPRRPWTKHRCRNTLPNRQPPQARSPALSSFPRRSSIFCVVRTRSGRPPSLARNHPRLLGRSRCSTSKRSGATSRRCISA